VYRTFTWTRASNARNVLTRAYEPIQPHLLNALAERSGCRVFIDVGANIGAYSLLMTTLDSVREVHAFEPSPDTFGELVGNVELNNLQARITAHQVALSDSSGIVRFGIVNRLSGANSIVDTSIHSKFAEQVEVRACRLDDRLSFDGQRICLKIDVEGHERQTLAGMAALLSGNSILLQIEDYSEREDELPELLGRFGLRSLCRVGPDRYFASGDSLIDRDLLEAFDQASRAMIEVGLAELQQVNGPEAAARIHLAGRPDVAIELTGSAARTARRIRNVFRRRRGGRG
jgi:FkbM family methyltransferase